MSTLKEKFKLAKESAKAIATNVINGEEILVSPHEAQRRLEICNGCPKLKTLGLLKQCSECGCSVSLKTKMADVSCPINSW